MANVTDDLYVRCTRKEGFPYWKARRVAKRIRRATDEAVTEYYCHDCKWWHVGGYPGARHTVKRRKRTQRRERV